MRRVAVLAAITAGACADDGTVDPGDLELRDLLGISPEIASSWNADQRAAARRVLVARLSADDASTRTTVDVTSLAATGRDGTARDATARNATARNATARDAAVRDATARDATARDATARDAMARDAMARAAMARDATARDATARDAMACDAMARDATARDVDDQIASLLETEDARRGGEGAEPFGLVRIAFGPGDVAFTPRSAAPTATAIDRARDLATARDPATARIATTELWLASQWDHSRPWGRLPGRGLDVLSTLAGDAGHPGGPIVVVPGPRLAAIAAYVEPRGDLREPRLAINPVLLAALEPDPEETALAAGLDRSAPPQPIHDRSARPPLTDTTAIASTGGNPYSFYGSVGECAFAQRTRCASCLAGSTCTPITDAPDGDTECGALGDNSGRGYFLLCINLSLAITSVDRCTADAAPSCARDPGAADSLVTLEANADFLADPACAGALDACLAKIYGAPDDPFPGVDGGEPPPGPPRSTSVSCGNGCDSSNNNCTASPSCDCTGPSCNNSLSCDSACSSSNDQRGCGGNCNACTSSGGGSSGNSGCGSSSSSSSDGCSSSSDGNSDSCGSGNSCGSCGSSSSGSSSCGGGSSCSSGGGSKCSVTASDPGPGIGVAMSLLWAILPVPVA
ncbi:MAG TPA: hypothetical protein VGD80_07720, partial [Kofleriaceae bacterium]